MEEHRLKSIPEDRAYPCAETWLSPFEEPDLLTTVDFTRAKYEEGEGIRGTV